MGNFESTSFRCMARDRGLMEFLIVLLFILLPVIMFAIGASQLAKAAETFAELKRNKRK